MPYDYQYDESWLNEVHVNEWSAIGRAKQFDKPLNKAWKTLESLLLLKVITLVDLSTLFGGDTISNVSGIVNKALHPLESHFVRTILNSVRQQLETINSLQSREKCSVTLNYQKIDSRKYIIRILGNNNDDNEYKDLNYEELLEVKQVLRILTLDEENVTDALATFLSVKDDLTVPEFEDNSKKTVRVAAVCVYPSFVKDATDLLKSKGLNKNTGNADSKFERGDSISVAVAAAGFPTGLYDLRSKVEEIEFSLGCGASEVDIVISRHLVIGHRWSELFNEIRTLKKSCGRAKMKTILAVGECGSLENVYKASMVAMMAGSDYIKTSTGKETVNATFPFGLVMCRAIRNFYIKTGKKVGFKPAGGIKSAEDALKWIRLIIIELGPDWLPLFRIGASAVLDSIEERLKQLHS